MGSAALGARQRVRLAEPAVLAKPGASHARAGARAAAQPVAGNRRAAEAAGGRVAERLLDVRPGPGLHCEGNNRCVELDPALIAPDLALAARLDLDRLGKLRTRLAGDQNRVAGL